MRGLRRLSSNPRLILKPSTHALLAVAMSMACSARRAPTPPDLPPASATQEGIASWYGIDEQGRATASGQFMDPEGMTAAHRTLEFGTIVRVFSFDSGQQVDVVVNDRGPFVGGRIIDLSWAAAKALDMVQSGTARVRVQVIGLDGELAARRWRVQVGSFGDRRRAQELKVRLGNEGFSPVVLSTFELEGTFHRVWVGEYRERDGAESLAERLRAVGLPTTIVYQAVPPG